MPYTKVPYPRCPEFNSTYPLKCRCTFCTAEHSRRRNVQRLHALERARGVKRDSDRLDPAETLELLQRANQNGASDDEIAKLTGLSSSTVYNIRHGISKFVRRATRDAVVQALRDNEDARAFTTGTKVPAKWTRSMVHALMAQGWPAHKQQQIIQENLGVPARFIFSVLRNLHDNIYYSNEQTMRWLVSEIGSAKGPSTRSMAFAERNGYFPTKHYDNEGNLVVRSLPKELRHRFEGV